MLLAEVKESGLRESGKVYFCEWLGELEQHNTWETSSTVEKRAGAVTASGLLMGHEKQMLFRPWQRSRASEAWLRFT